MSLPSPDLDDRRFQDIVDEAKRLIPKYCPEWTNHNVSDPGVALIELFAWMTEMVLYRLNQVPDRLYTKFLDLLGVSPFPATAARADLTFYLSEVSDGDVVVPKGTQVATSITELDPVVFTTMEDLVISQPRLEAAVTAEAGREQYTSIIEHLTYAGDTAPVFASDPIQVGDAMFLGFADSLAGNLIRVGVEASIEGIGVDPSQPPVSWEVWSGEAWIPVDVVEDTTGGLNRNGSVVLRVPPVHEQLTLGDMRHFWLRVVLTQPRPGVPTYQRSPQVRTVVVESVGGSVTAEHADVAGAESLGVSSGAADQVFRVANRPVLPRRPEERVRVITDAGVEDWDEVDDFIRSGPDDRHYLWDDATGEIRFGPRIRYPDGSIQQHGAIPASGAEISVSGYRYGGGARGNVGSHTLTAMRMSIPYVASVTNLRPARGGVDAETVDNAKRRGPLTLRTGGRAVTVDDYERLAAEASLSVARARCLPPAEHGGPIRLLITPHVGRPVHEHVLDDFALTDPLVRRIVDYLEPRRILGTTVEISTPYYQGVTVAALLKALPGRSEQVVRQRALDVLYRYVNPLEGGPDQSGWPYEVDLNATVLYQLLGGIDGVERVDEVLLFEYDLRNHERLGAAREVIRLSPDSLFLSARHAVVVR